MAHRVGKVPKECIPIITAEWNPSTMIETIEQVMTEHHHITRNLIDKDEDNRSGSKEVEGALAGVKTSNEVYEQRNNQHQ